MLRVAAGDTAAFAALYDRHHRSVARFAHRFVRDAGKAEELTQDIFVKVYRHAGRYRATARFKTFLFRVAANHCLNEVRRGEYRVTHVPEHDEEGRPVEMPAPEAQARNCACWGLIPMCSKSALVKLAQPSSRQHATSLTAGATSCSPIPTATSGLWACRSGKRDDQPGC